MALTREQQEEILNNLNNPELDHIARTENLQLLRTHLGETDSTITKQTESIEHLQKDNSDLVVANSKLFRQIGIQDDPSLKQQEDKKEFSETVSLESLGL